MLKDFVENFLHIQIQSKIEHTGMADSVMPNTISFLTNAKFADAINKNANIIAAFVKEKDVHALCDRLETIIVDDPKATLFTIHNEYCKNYLAYQPNRIASSAKIHPTASVAEKGVILGENVMIGPHTTIFSGVEIGDNSTVGANCVIGGEGFHVFEDLKGIKRIAIHDGKVIIGRYVDIQSATCVDKGFMGRDTVISDEAKIDNLLYIGHRVYIGKRSLLAAGTCLGGSDIINDDVWIGTQCNIANRITIEKNASIKLGAVVIRDVKSGEQVSGNFAINHVKHLMSDMRTDRSK